MKQNDIANWILEFSSFLPFFIILQQKEYKAFIKHLPYFKGNSKCFAWLQQQKSLFFKHIHWVSDACTCTITKIKLTNKEREEKGGKHNTLGEPREDEHFLRVGRGENLDHITGKDREKHSYRGEEKRSNTSSHAKCRGPMTFYQSRAIFYSLQFGIDENVQFCKGCHIIAVNKLLNACLAILAFA